jgi:hypothetical protein
MIEVDLGLEAVLCDSLEDVVFDFEEDLEFRDEDMQHHGLMASIFESQQDSKFLSIDHNKKTVSYRILK